MGDMTLPPRGCSRAGANLSVATEVGGHLLAILMDLSLGSPDRPVGRTTYRAAGMTRATSSARNQRAARRLTKFPQRKGNFKPNSGVRCREKSSEAWAEA